MHLSSYAKMEAFFRSYSGSFPAEAGRSRVLEIGSKIYEGQRSYRALIDKERQSYVGLDLEPGLNVDIVARDSFVWPEIGDGSFDVCISGQTFEHNPYFWVTMCELARVLAAGGLACIIAPGAGPVHRYPVDCWRFYPDSWPALCRLAGLEPLETYLETDAVAEAVAGGEWRDSMLIARKPDLPPEKAAKAEALRRRITDPFREEFQPPGEGPGPGPAVAEYLRSVPRRSPAGLRKRLARRLYRPRTLPIHQGRR
ncbi:MAG: methyltransferase domain-containing protein [Sphingomonadaceae bacterium]